MEDVTIELLLDKIKKLEQQLEAIEGAKNARMRWIMQFVVIVLSLIVSHGSNANIITQEFLEAYILFNNVESTESN